MKFSRPKYTRRYTAVATTERAAWGLPPWPLRLMMLAALLGAAAFAWSERQLFTRVAQVAVLQDRPMPGRNGAEVWPPGNGAVTWSLVRGGAAGPEIHARIEVPAVALSLTLIIRKNTDPALPASHLIEIEASVPGAFQQRQIAAVGVPEFRRTPDRPPEEPLRGTLADLGAGKFLFGLSPVPVDVKANLALMRAGFIALPLVYGSGQRGTLTFEKGSMGAPVFEEALAAWNR